MRRMNKDEKLSALRDIENEYLRYFARVEEYEHYTRFTDPELPTMYSHNCVVFKGTLTEPELHRQIRILFEDAQARGAAHLCIDLHPNHPFTMNDWEAERFERSSVLYMTMPLEAFRKAAANTACEVRRATTPVLCQDAMWCGITASLMEGSKHIDYEFACRSASRKHAVFEMYPATFSRYVAYLDGIPVGKCEVSRHGAIFCPDSFLVVRGFQRRGIGTAILGRIVEEARAAGGRELFLLTDAEDTARDMYAKAGFQAVGVEHNLLWLKEGKGGQSG